LTHNALICRASDYKITVQPLLKDTCKVYEDTSEFKQAFHHDCNNMQART